MAARKVTTKAQDNPLIKRLKQLGCTFCPACYAYMFPDHREHSRALAVDQHASHYKIVGGFGQVRVVDLNDQGEAA